MLDLNTSDNLESIQNEIEALEAVFINNELKVESNDLVYEVTLTFRLDEDDELTGEEATWYSIGDEIKCKRLPQMELKFTLDAKTYPSEDEPPPFEVLGFWSQFTSYISGVFNPLYYQGQNVIFDWFQAAKDLIQDKHMLELLQTADTKEFENSMLKALLLSIEQNGVTCEICYERFEKVDEIYAFARCQHVFCKACIRDAITLQIKDGQLDKVNCPAFSEATNKLCTSRVTERARKIIGVSQEIEEKYERFSINQAVESMEDVAWCPNEGCKGLAKVNTQLSHAKCVDCYYQFCTKCLKAYHPMRRCEVTQINNAEKFLAQSKDGEMSEQAKKAFEDAKQKFLARTQALRQEAFLKRISKRCPTCQNMIQKWYGCNKMTCNECGTYFCYVCEAKLDKLKPYAHFDESPKCWSSDFGEVNNMGHFEKEEAAMTSAQKMDEMIKAGKLDEVMRDSTFCPQCNMIYMRGFARINLLDCQTCLIQFCFSCGDKFQTKEQADAHFEHSNCYYKEI